jgi:monoamine oxidase
MGGAYLAFGPGQISKFWRLWERPIQRVAFAGEHTDTMYPGTLEGALRTGQRAASQVEDLAAGKSFEPAKVGPAATAAAAAGAGAVAAKKGNFFSNLFGGSDDAKKPEPVKAPEPAPAAPAPAPAPAPTPAPAPVEAPKPAAPVKAEPAKNAPAKAPAKKPAAKTEAKKAPAKAPAKKAEVA